MTAGLIQEPLQRRAEVARSADDRKAVRDSLWLTLGGQLERAIGTITALSLRWGLNPETLGVYTGLRLYLDNTNRSSLGIGLGAVQEIPILRAAGQETEARHLANVTYTTNTITCAIFSASILILAAWKASGGGSTLLDREWIWGLVAIAALALIKRHETFLVAILRAHREFALTAELDIVESFASAILVPIGLWCAGLRGLLVAVGLVLLIKVGYAQYRHPIRFQWCWDLPLAWRLMRVGLPILANTAVFGAVLTMDRILILWRHPNGERAAGLYLIAIMGTSWCLDLAGRIVLVLYTSFQSTLGRTNDASEVVRQSIRANEAQATLILAGASIAYLAGPVFLGFAMPRYTEGLNALRPLLPGSVLVALAWPARQVLITLGRTLALFVATLSGLGVVALTGTLGLDRNGIVGLAWGMSIGYAALFLATTAASIIPFLGLRGWVEHLGRLSITLMGFSLATLIGVHTPIGLNDGPATFIVRFMFMLSWMVPTLWFWGERNDWGGFSLMSRPKSIRTMPKSI